MRSHGKYLAGRNFRGVPILNVGTGLNAAGEWRVQPGKLCGRLHTSPDICKDVRILGDASFCKRDNGDVVKSLPQRTGR